MPPSHITVIGSLNVDLIARVPHFPGRGENVTTRSFELLIGGGKGGNQAVALARLGASVAMIGMLGRQLDGPAYRVVLAQEGVDVRGVGLIDGLPGLGLVAVDDGGENQIIVHPGANAAVTAAHVDEHWPLGKVGAILVQNEIPMATTLHVLRRAQAAGIMTICDPAPAPAAALGLPDEVLALATVLTPNRSELSIISGEPVTDADSTIHAAQCLIRRGANTVVAKVGGDGAWIITKDAVRHVPPFAVRVVDCTAAGDAFNAGLAFALVDGQTMSNAVRFANAVGALATTGLGAQTALPTLSAVQQFMSAQSLGAIA